MGAVEDLPADKVFGAIFQYPGTHGNVRDFTKVIKELHEHKALVTIIADPLALALLKSPGEMDADIAVVPRKDLACRWVMADPTPPIWRVARITNA